jgi:hypothetical protein
LENHLSFHIEAYTVLANSIVAPQNVFTLFKSVQYTSQAAIFHIWISSLVFFGTSGDCGVFVSLHRWRDCEGTLVYFDDFSCRGRLANVFEAHGGKAGSKIV